MSFTEKRELRINSVEGGSISLQREGNDVSIVQTVYYRNDAGDVPIQLDDVDRRKLMEFLNMGEYRELTYGESR
jgi:hypothetical protein